LIPSIQNLELEDPLINQAMSALADGTPYPGRPEIAYYWQPLKSAIRAVLLDQANPDKVLAETADKIIQDLQNAPNSGTGE
jgi:maltose-binding protein MalE